MIWIIARRELLEYLLSMKFIIGFSITIALVILSTFINVNDFQQRLNDYNAAQQDMKSDFFYIRVYRPPEVLSTIIQGKDRALGNRLEMTYLRLPPKTTGYMGEGRSQHHRYVAGFASIDYAFIVRIILSLLVIFLSYNAVAGEKTMGTLRLVCTNSMPRHVVLLGKFIGGLIVILLALTVATVCMLLVLIFNPSISLGAGEWTRILSMFVGSALYLSCFFTLGLFISVVINRPSMALTVLLQIWIFFTIIYPNIAIITSESIFTLPTTEEINQQKKAAFQPYEAEYKIVQAEFVKVVHSGERTSNELWLKQVELNVKKAELEYAVDMEFSNKLTYQLEMANILSVLSPAALYDNAVTRYAGTSIDNFGRFMEGVSRYWQQHVELAKLRIQHPEERAKYKLPPFTFSSEPASESIIGTALQICVMFLLSVIFFMLAYTKFLNKDVR
jgi:ABC-type transport system involved in multi-copper enzyme maturation permease subunit